MGLSGGTSPDCSRFESVRKAVAEAAQKAGRDASEVRVLAVSKRKPATAVVEAVACGQTLFGENYVQEAVAKMEELAPEVRQRTTWHFIGHLQRNKVKLAVRYFHWIETVDSIKLAREISKRSLAQATRTVVLVQVNIGKDPAKSGVSPEEVEPLLEQISGLDGIELRGLMTIPPKSPDPEEARRHFAALRRLRDRVDPKGTSLPELSMGMSGDFRQAIEEGATIVRIGTALFGPRD